MSFKHQRNQLFVAIAVCALSACSRQASAPSAAKDAGEAPTTAAATTATPVNLDCAKVFTPADVAGIMPGTAALTTFTARADACLFKTPDTSQIQVSADSDLERALWDDPNQRQIGQYKPVAGLGDEAFARMNDEGGQIYIKKGGHYCGVLAGLNSPKVTGDALVQQLGALCNKVFALG